ncbi:hypothetical protein L1987_35579 [Smallanthus sonchifolius]|uniref:Uncharacterized protein n=1 Tax=Smallanthus sonchifolius TaxID=185202 RepID=A0ACB9HB75_9ASTR|nr:hypothetical protein L1987_35579 [Smallanthus sonchifolius]
MNYRKIELRIFHWHITPVIPFGISYYSLISIHKSMHSKEMFCCCSAGPAFTYISISQDATGQLLDDGQLLLQQP